MNKLSITDLPIQGKKILMRVDFNVPLNEDGTIADDTRIRAALPSIQYVLDHQGSLILMSHLGRPKEGKNPKLSLRPVAMRLSELLDKPVLMAPDCIGDEVEKMTDTLSQEDVLLLENLRFYPAETKPESDPTFAEKLAKLADFYVNDAFGSAHRKHSSTYTITQYFPHKAAGGFLLNKEVSFLSKCLQNPARPFYAIIGGAKLSSKMGIIKNLIDKVDALFIGGGMGYTFFKAQGINIGKSLFEEELLEVAKDILQKCKEKNIPLYLPTDVVIADALANDANTKVITMQTGIPPEWEGVDIGPHTVKTWSSILGKGATIFWNGPLGVFEIHNFSLGTEEIAQMLSNTHAITVVGGGDSVAAINKMGIGDKFSHLSTGGGASLEFLEFGHLPGIDALSDK
ncbi:MAG: phosphoglycerate kinase [Parachlamydiales bacterium]|nr:phosphoglycerate kinase [Parachlamydiales bacterium]